MLTTEQAFRLTKHTCLGFIAFGGIGVRPDRPAMSLAAVVAAFSWHQPRLQKGESLEIFPLSIKDRYVTDDWKPPVI